jgi:hypothetical protein
MSRAETIPAIMKMRMSSTSLMAYTSDQSVSFNVPSSSSRVIALKFHLLSETNLIVPGQRPPALTVVTTGLWSVVASGVTLDSETSPLE